MSSSRRTRTTFQRFIESEASGGVLLMGSAALALAVANTFLGDAYKEVLHARIAGLDLLHWINDGLMSFFFLLVGLEGRHGFSPMCCSAFCCGPRCYSQASTQRLPGSCLP
jgi:NhaA family Na+:H+ antiporter